MLTANERLIVTQTGLPDLAVNAFQFYFSNDKFRLTSANDVKYIVFGEYSGNCLGIELQSRQIHLRLTHAHRSIFVNQNLKSFLLFLIEADTHYSHIPEKSDLNKLTKNMHQIDTKALSEKTHFWSTMLDDMHYGLV